MHVSNINRKIVITPQSTANRPLMTAICLMYLLFCVFFVLLKSMQVIEDCFVFRMNGYSYISANDFEEDKVFK